MKKSKVAIFDIDGTIFRSSLLIELVDALIRAGIFPDKAKAVYAKAYKDWVNRKDSYEKYIYSVVAAFEKNIKGVERRVFNKIAREVVSANNDRVYSYTRDLVKELKKKNYYLLAISHSPKEIVQSFCKKLGFNKVYGRVYETDKNNKFTGQTLFLDLINDKAQVLRRAVAKENLTLVGSIGVGDSEGDITLLSLVANPICFNPNGRLYAQAKKAGWKIVVERKDVIYKM
jgi:HAD superfamily hydrolase (TIGR01490 family)